MLVGKSIHIVLIQNCRYDDGVVRFNGSNACLTYQLYDKVDDRPNTYVIYRQPFKFQ